MSPTPASTSSTRRTNLGTPQNQNIKINTVNPTMPTRNTATTKPADITASDYVTPSNLRDTGKIDTRDVPTPLKTTNLYDNVWD